MLEMVAQEPFFETHNHQPGYSRHDWTTITHREFLSYAGSDLAVAAGPELAGVELSDEELFGLWPFVRTTGYGRAVEEGVRLVLGLEYRLENVAAMNDGLRAFAQNRGSAEIYAELFRLAGIEGSVNDVLPADDIGTTLRMHHGEFPSFFRFAPRFEGLHAVRSMETIRELEEHLDCSVTSLGDLTGAIEFLLDRAVGQGHVCALKIGLAYRRALDFEKPEPGAAERAFSSLLRGADEDLKPLHDALFHHAVRCARARGLVVQIHTGTLAGFGSDMRRGDPSPLVPVFMAYPDVRFDLFHAAWPWSEMLGAIGKHFPNVWLDLCWAWSMNPVQMERTLDEWLSAVPGNKILAYGSDTTTPFAVPGYAFQARQGISAVLERKMERGEYDENTARCVARRIMHENARQLFSGDGDA